MAYKILSLNGGGVRSIFQTTLLHELSKTKELKEFWKDFDLIIGTSAGAIVGAGLRAGKTPKAIENFFDDAKTLFPPEWLIQTFRFLKRPEAKIAKEIAMSFLPAFVSLAAEKGAKAAADKWLEVKVEDYSKRLGAKLRKFLPNTTLGKFCTKSNCFAVTASLLDNSAVRVFFPHVFKYDDEVNVIDAVRASAAAPGFFNAVTIDEVDWRSKVHKHRKRDYIDGGLWANSPALAAVAVAHCEGDAKLSGIRLVSIGTGSRPHSVTRPKYDELIANTDKTGLLWHLLATLGTIGEDKDKQGVYRFLRKEGESAKSYVDILTDEHYKKNALYIDAITDEPIELWEYKQAKKHLPALAIKQAKECREELIQLIKE